MNHFFETNLDSDISFLDRYLSQIKKNKKNSKDLDEDLSAVHSFIQSIIERENISFPELIELVKQKRTQKKILTIPSSIFSNRKFGILESISKYLKENLKLRFTEISQLINKDQRVIWTSYNNSRKKSKKRFQIKKNSLLIPITIFKNKKLGPLESLVLYLKENLNLKNKDISKLLNRNPKTIWSSYNKAKKKVNVKKK